MKRTHGLLYISFAVQGILFVAAAVAYIIAARHVAFFRLARAVGLVVALCGIVQALCAAAVLVRNVLAMHILFRGCIDIAAGAVLLVCRTVTPRLAAGIIGIVLLEKSFTAFYLAFALQLAVAGGGQLPDRHRRIFHAGGILLLAVSAFFVLYAANDRALPFAAVPVSCVAAAAVNFYTSRCLYRMS